MSVRKRQRSRNRNRTVCITQGCKKIARNSKARRCTSCQTGRMHCRGSRTCSFDECWRPTNFPHHHCTLHIPRKTPVLKAVCISCKLFPRRRTNTKQSTPILQCHYCDENESRRSKDVFTEVETVLQQLFQEPNYHDSLVHSLTFTPCVSTDLSPPHTPLVKKKHTTSVFTPYLHTELAGHCVVIEIDEEQHSRYNKVLELKRQHVIAEALGKPTVFIRYNPSSFHHEDTHALITVSKEDRHNLLCDRVRLFMTAAAPFLFPINEYVLTDFLFYEPKNRF